MQKWPFALSMYQFLFQFILHSLHAQLFDVELILNRCERQCTLSYKWSFSTSHVIIGTVTNTQFQSIFQEFAYILSTYMYMSLPNMYFSPLPGFLKLVTF